MFRANHSCFGHEETVPSTLPFYEVAPSNPSLCATWECEKMVASVMPVLVIVAVAAAKNSTMLSSFLLRRQRSVLGIVIFVHYPNNRRKPENIHLVLHKSPQDTNHDSTRASTSCSRGYYSKMAPGTVKRPIRLVFSASMKECTRSFVAKTWP